MDMESGFSNPPDAHTIASQSLGDPVSLQVINERNKTLVALQTEICILIFEMPWATSPPVRRAIP